MDLVPNVKSELKGDKLTLEIDLSKRLGPSASGKTQIIASTKGNIELPGKQGVKIGLSVFTK